MLHAATSWCEVIDTVLLVVLVFMGAPFGRLRP
jgi:hypothetical protein